VGTSWPVAAPAQQLPRSTRTREKWQQAERGSLDLFVLIITGISFQTVFNSYSYFSGEFDSRKMVFYFTSDGE